MSTKGFISNDLIPVIRRLTRAYSEALRPFNLKPVEAHILAELLDKGPQKVGVLGRRLALSGSTLTGALDRLEKRELIRREADPDDRRAYRLVATGFRGKKRTEFALVFVDVDGEFFSPLTRAERTQFQTLLRKLNP